MLSINNFISEKLKVNSKTKINESLVDEIIEMWGVKYYKDFYKNRINDLREVLEIWIKNFDVKEIKFYSPAWAINKMEEHGIPKHIRDNYITCDSDNAYIYDYLNNGVDVYLDTRDQNVFIDKDGNKHNFYVVSDYKRNIMSFNVEDCGVRICHKEN